MSSAMQIVVVAAATLALFSAPSPVLARLLRPSGPEGSAASRRRRGVTIQVATIVARLVLALLFVVALILGDIQPRDRIFARVVTVGVTQSASRKECTANVS